jgi:16S rRNA processing protein RimM
MTDNDYISVGEVLAAHGQKGEVRVRLLTEFPERFSKGAEVFIEGAPYRIESARITKETAIIRLNGVESPQAAALLRGKKLEIPERARKELPAGRYYHHDIIGLEVWTTSGTLLGKVSEVLSTGGNDIFVVKNSGKEVLIPAVKDVVKQIDVPNKRITIKEIEGLLG